MFSLFGLLGSKAQTPKSIHSFKVEALDGSTIDFSKFKGKKILIVNTASQCGFTPQYEDLEKLYETYKDKLVIVGFPANNFGGQEPGTNQEIGAFCQKNYGVTFPMAAKVSVKGKDIAPIFEFLTDKKLNEEIREYCLAKKGVTEGDKMFLLMDLESQPLKFSAKADPEWSEDLREQYHQITGAYHMNKTHWNTISVDGLKPDFVLELIDHSYDLVFKSLTRRVKEEILKN
ncbi:hypothetical protein Lal_00042781 [Lupinus albus]|nr:hypothetical protein Lal_00042781 [Lupinus albus]